MFSFFFYFLLKEHVVTLNLIFEKPSLLHLILHFPRFGKQKLKMHIQLKVRLHNNLIDKLF